MDNIRNVALKTAVNATPEMFPLCMLDSSGKTLGRFIFNRIETAIGHLLADNQYGLRKGRSTVNAINQVVDKGKEAISGNRGKAGASSTICDSYISS